MNDDITKYCNSCKHCKLRKADYRVPRLPLSRYPGVTRAFQRVHIDLVGPLTKTDSGYEYILVIKDALTQWIELIPLYEKAMQHGKYSKPCTVDMEQQNNKYRTKGQNLSTR